MKKRSNQNLVKNIKFDRFLVSLLVLFIFVANLTSFYSTIIKFSQESHTIKDNDLLGTSSSSGGGYLMNHNASYSWIEISTSGTLMNISSDNDDYNAISFIGEGWNFTYYEKQYNTIYVSSNGWMSFTNL